MSTYTKSSQISKRQMANIILATDMSRKHPHDMRWHFASLLCRGNTVISTGFNTYKTHPESKHPYSQGIHAELSAIIGLDRHKVIGATMFIARTGGHGRKKIMIAKPCPECQVMLESAGLKEVFYSIDETTVGKWSIRSNIWKEIKIG